MARGVRSTPTLLPVFSANLQPQSLASYDPLTRRNTILVANIVPTISLSENSGGMALFIPSDRYYTNIGAWDSAARVPPWLQNVTGLTYKSWNSTKNRYYVTHAAAATLYSSFASIIHPLGHAGAAASYAPKNSGVAAVWVRFSAAFITNGDYGTDGIGAKASATAAFDTATDHFFQVLRNSGVWELGTCDGASISQQASAAPADGDEHEFGVRWSTTDIRLYVDDVLVVTKTTNLPNRPLNPVALMASGGVNIINLVDYLIEWEAA